ncbi:hypothetical protein ACT17_14590 [Mycolicibacterium conceptionense]|uniref:Uncharacterized protein n=1 Tax=Mycolicibacterium conceptionense TaxID=451644 RepID=A0A0J8U7N2_9MYCO|nr:hypothetical protein [Mycolicibacterium conceptionense]KMV17523.1 hypothetical protein ACT17_14590 [Mycolicibacterium conceptionense]
MQIPDSIIDPATAEINTWKYVVALKDDDWDHWDSIPRDSKFNGARKGATGRWNLRNLTTGSPVDWDYADDEIVVLEVLS